VNDAEAFGDLKIAMTVLGITNDTQDCIFKVLSAILLLGNVEFKSDGKDGCAVKNPAELAGVAELLGVDTARLTTTLTVRNMKVVFLFVLFTADIYYDFTGEGNKLEYPP
jgi:myosin heavy subunit